MSLSIQRTIKTDVRRPVLMRQHSVRSSLMAFLVLTLASAAAVAQDSLLAKESSNPEALIRAARSYGLMGSDVPPWRMKINYELFDKQGTIRDWGTYEEFWVSAKRYKRVYASARFSRTEYGTDKGVLRTGNPRSPSFPLEKLRTAIVTPLPSERSITQANIDMRAVSAETPQSESSSNTLQCFEVSFDAQPSVAGPQTGYCFDALGVLAQYPIDSSVGVWRAIFKNPVNFYGHILPGHLVIEHAGTTVLAARLVSIEALTETEGAEFQPPLDASPVGIPIIDEILGPISVAKQQGDSHIVPGRATGQTAINISAGAAQKLLVKKIDPVYPASGHATGAVILQATIDKNGLVADLSVISGPATLQEAVLRAVQKWIYRPYIVNGIPVDFQTTISVDCKDSQSPD